MSVAAVKDNRRWESYNNWNPKGPYIILIVDCDWWDDNWDKISEWFDLNCPDAKPEPNDSVVTFRDQSQFTMWRLSWGM